MGRWEGREGGGGKGVMGSEEEKGGWEEEGREGGEMVRSEEAKRGREEEKGGRQEEKGGGRERR